MLWGYVLGRQVVVNRGALVIEYYVSIEVPEFESLLSLLANVQGR